VKRNYYRDREKGEYVYLLDRSLEFEGTGSFSPLIEEAALELAITGPSYRKAEHTLETLLGYRVISHEAIRQHLLQIESIPKERQPVNYPVLFVEVDGLYVKRQGKGKRGKEEKLQRFIRAGKSRKTSKFERQTPFYSPWEPAILGGV
jgi:hypothetical protein